MTRNGERIDDLQRGGFRIIQDPERFCFGMDAVLLADFARIRPGERVLDLGTGTGIIPLLQLARYEDTSYVGLEIDPSSADMARRSMELNQVSDQIVIVEGDLRRTDAYFAPGSFDAVTANPPYMIAGHGLHSREESLNAARHEILCTLEDVVSAASRALRAQGRFFMVHRPFRLAEIITQLTRYKLEPKRMRLVYPTAVREPNMVLIEARKGGRPRMSVEPPLIVYSEPGVYSQEILKIYGAEDKAVL